MFNSKRVFGLALLTIATALSGCGGSSGGSQEELPTCENGQVYDDTLTPPSCRDRLHICAAGTRYPDGYEVTLDSTQANCELIPFEGPAPEVIASEDLGDNQVVIYYNRGHVDGSYEGYNLYRFGDCWTELDAWPGNELPEIQGVDPVYGAYFYVEIDPACAAQAASGAPTSTNYIINNGAGDQTADLSITLNDTAETPNLYRRMSFFISSDTGGLGSNVGARVSGPAAPICLDPPEGSDEVCLVPELPPRIIRDFAAHWIDAETVAWNIDVANPVLYVDLDGGGFEQDAAGSIVTDGSILDADGLICTTEACLAAEPVVPEGGSGPVSNGIMAISSLTATSFTDAQQNDSTLSSVTGSGWQAYSITQTLEAADIKTYLKGQLLMTGTQVIGGGDDQLWGTFVQAGRMLDALYVGDGSETNGLAENAGLGITYNGANIDVSIWAPTVDNMQLNVYSAGAPRFRVAEIPMTENTNTGVWSVSIDANEYDGLYYLYQMATIDPNSSEPTLVLSSDPYAVNVSEDGIYSQFLNLDSDTFKPSDWDTYTRPDSVAATSAVVYEAHIRDFSIFDATVSPLSRGNYSAFTETESGPIAHLAALQESGVTHVNFMPFYDFADVTESTGWALDLFSPVEAMCLRFRSDPPAVCLSGSGVDARDSIAQVVFDLTSVDPFDPMANEVLERIRDVDSYNWGYEPVHLGAPEGSYSSNPENTSRVTELRGMIKALHEMGLGVTMDVVFNRMDSAGLVVPQSSFDKIVPGYYFRRDAVTGGYSRTNECCMDVATERAMAGEFVKDTLVHWVENYNIDGFRFDSLDYHPSSLLVAAATEVEAANGDRTALIMGDNGSASAGAGVGSLNDAMQSEISDLTLTRIAQEYIPLRDFAGDDQDAADAANATINKTGTDAIRVGLAGNLAAFPYYNSLGAEVVGGDAPLNATGQSPAENVAYAELHDTQTLWDAMHNSDNYSVVSALTTEQRIALQMVSFSIPVFSQGVTHFQMGSEILRSKSGESFSDTEGFNSGDWFNYVDFSYTFNNWAVAHPEGAGAPEEGATPSALYTAISTAFGDDNALVETADIASAFAKAQELISISQSSPLFSLSTADEVIARVGFHNQGLFQIPGLIMMSVDDGSDLADGSADLDPNYDAVMVAFNGSPEALTKAVEGAEGFVVHPDHNVTGASFSEGSFTVPAFTTVVFVKPQGASVGVGLSRDASPAPAPGAPFGTEALFLRGEAMGWGATVEQQMIYVGDDTYEAVLSVTGDQTNRFKIANEGWSLELGLTDDPGTNTIALDTETTIAQGCGGACGITFAFTDGQEYLFSLNAAETSAPTLTISAYTGAPYAADLYIRGNLNDWATLTDADLMDHNGLGIYTLAREIPTASPSATEITDANFKFASEDWAAANLGSGVAGGAVVIDSPLALNNAGDSGNLTITAAAGNTYFFEVNARGDINAPTLITSTPTFGNEGVFLRGVGGDWSANPARQFVYVGNNVYQLDITFTADDYNIDTDGDDVADAVQFKVAEDDWGSTDGEAPYVNFGILAGSDPVAAGGAFLMSTPSAGDDNGNMIIEPDVDTPTTYRFLLDVSAEIAPTFRITPYGTAP